MQLSCIHTHTNFCDGADDVETFCRTAHEKGFKSLGFSAHAPVKRKTGIPSDWHVSDEELEEYLDTVLDAQKRWAGKLTVYQGLEIDYIPGLMGPADKEYREMGLDFIIGAVHYVLPPKGAPFTVDDKLDIVLKGIKEGYGGDNMAMLEAYLDSMEQMVREGGFDVLAHPDVVKKNNIAPDGRIDRIFNETDDYYLNRIKTLAELMGKPDMGQVLVVEVNTGGLNRGRTKDCYPSLPFLKLFREQGVPAVINSDAHSADHLDGYYSEAQKALLAAGYTETVTFEGRQDGKAVWKSVKL